MNEIVAACQYQDVIYIFTRSGKIYEMRRYAFDGRVEFKLMHNLFPDD